MRAFPDPSLGTYYTRRQQRSMEPSDFQLDLEDLEWVKRAMNEIARASGADRLGDLYEKILDLADGFEPVGEVEDVSPYIYVMF